MSSLGILVNIVKLPQFRFLSGSYNFSWATGELGYSSNNIKFN